MNKRAVAVALLALALITPMRMLRAEGYEKGEKSEWKKELGLSADQVKKMDDLKAAEKAEMKPLKEKNDALVLKLKDQVKNKASDADIKATLGEITANHNAMEASEDKFKESKSSILTPTQQAKMVIHHMKHHENMEKEEKDEKEDDDKK